MAPASKPPRVRKRNRKRKRRNVSSSSSSSSSSEDEQPQTVPPPAKLPPQVSTPVEKPQDLDDSDSDSDSSSSSSASGSSASSTKRTNLEAGPSKPTKLRQPPSRSPSPPNTAIPPLISQNPTIASELEKEKLLKEKFRKFWMASVADAFKDDLEEIRKEPNLTTSRLSLLIESLASGADVFSSKATTQGGDSQVNEMEVVLGSPST